MSEQTIRFVLLLGVLLGAAMKIIGLSVLYKRRRRDREAIIDGQSS